MHHHLQAAWDAVDEAAGSLPPEVLGRSTPGRWSGADILEHLTLAFTANAAVFEKALASGTLKARPPKVWQRLLSTLVIGLGYFPKVETPELTRPHGTIAPERSVAAYREALTALDSAMERVVQRFGDHVAAANHPYFAGLSVRQWRKFHWRHTVHHMRQLKERCSG